MDLSDNQLAALAGAGDTAAFQKLFERYQQPVYNFVYRLVENAEDASDIVQDAFIKMYGVLGAKDIQNFSAYLYRTAKNLAYDEMRRRTRFADVDHELLAPEDPNIYADPQRALLLGDQVDKVRQAAARLNENQRAALILRELEDLDYDRMSEILESNRNAVGALLSRARLRLREELRMAQIKTDTCPPECEEIVAMLSPYIDGELTPEEEAAVSAHLEICVFCAAALAEMREASRSFRMFIPVIPPADMARAFTGRLQELAGQGSGASGQDGSAGDSAGSGQAQLQQTLPQPPGQAGQPPAGVAKRPLPARILSHKAALFAGAVVAVFAISAFLLAEETGSPQSDTAGSDDISATSVAAPGQLSRNGLDSDPAAVAITDQTAPQAAGAMSAAGASQEPASGQPGGSPAPAAPPVAVVSGYVSPNPVYEMQNAVYGATISGGASSVTVKLVGIRSGLTLTEVTLSRQSGGSGRETWVASGKIPSHSAGTYSIIVTVTGPQGQSGSRNVGDLVIQPTIY